VPSRKGSPNRSTARTREAIALFAERNAHKLEEWLLQTADGVKDEDDNWLVRPDPKGAASIYKDMIEYHIPKLQRIEGEINHTTDKAWLEKLNDPKVIEGDYETN